MTAGDVVLLPMAQPLGSPKLRPALVLSDLPGPYQNLLVCGISTQLHLIQPNWDEMIQPSDSDFAASGLHQASVIRLSYLAAITSREVAGTIGNVDQARVERLRERLSTHLSQ